MEILDQQEEETIGKYGKKALFFSLLSILTFVLQIILNIIIPISLIQSWGSEKIFGLFFILMFILSVIGSIKGMRAIRKKENGIKRYIALSLSTMLLLFFLLTIVANMIDLSRLSS